MYNTHIHTHTSSCTHTLPLILTFTVAQSLSPHLKSNPTYSYAYTHTSIMNTPLSLPLKHHIHPIKVHTLLPLTAIAPRTSLSLHQQHYTTCTSTHYPLPSTLHYSLTPLT